jgi:glucokinase
VLVQGSIYLGDDNTPNTLSILGRSSFIEAPQHKGRTSNPLAQELVRLILYLKVALTGGGVLWSGNGLHEQV